MVAQILNQLACEAGNILIGVQRTSMLNAPLPLALKPFTVGALGNFPYYWQNPSNLKFNHLTYNWISANLMAHTTPAELDGNFINYYIEALASISYQLSSADQAKLTQAQQNAFRQQAALLNAWLTVYGTIPPGIGTQQPIDVVINIITTQWASPATDLPTMQSAPNLNKLLNTMPASGAPILPVLKNYLNALGSSISLYNAASMNSGYLAQALSAAQFPSVSNGGLALDNGLTNAAYAISTPLEDILDGLKDTSATVSVSMTVSPSDSNAYTVSVDNSTTFNVLPSEFLSIFIRNNTDYFKNLVIASASPVQVQMSFPGVTMVNYGPVAYSKSTAQSWYWMKPITDAINNGNRDVSGFKFLPDPQIDFSQSGPFGFLTGVAISNYPTVVVTAVSSNYQRIGTALQQAGSLQASLMGVPLAGTPGSPYQSSTQINNFNSSVTLTLSPPPELVAGQAVNSVGWVLGVLTSYPAAS